MSSKSCLRLAVGLILVSIVVMLFACGAFYWFFASWTDSPSPTEVIREQTEQLLQAARIGPNDPVPTEMADYRRYERQLCGNLLTELLKRNKNQYLINVVG